MTSINEGSHADAIPTQDFATAVDITETDEGVDFITSFMVSGGSGEFAGKWKKLRCCGAVFLATRLNVCLELVTSILEAETDLYELRPREPDTAAEVEASQDANQWPDDEFWIENLSKAFSEKVELTESTKEDMRHLVEFGEKLLYYCSGAETAKKNQDQIDKLINLCEGFKLSASRLATSLSHKDL